MDSGNYADIVYIPFLLGLLLFGLVIALVGFWRVGASYATQRSAQVGAVSPGQGNAVLADAWSGWTNGNAPTDGFAVDAQNRTVRAAIDTNKSFEVPELGLWGFSISAGGNMRVRSERFYPGQPVCDGGTCDE